MNSEHSPESEVIPLQEEVSLQIGEKRDFTFWFKLWGNHLQIIAGILFLIGFLWLNHWIEENYFYLHYLFLFFALVLALSILAACLIFSPYLGGNKDACRIVRKQYPDLLGKPMSYIIQVAFEPRICRGLEGVLDDGDDIGVLWMEGDRLEYAGDALRLTIPFSRIASRTFLNPAPRQFWLGGIRIRLLLDTLDEHRVCIINIREGFTFLSEKRRANEMVSSMEAVIDEWLVREARMDLKEPHRPDKRYPFQQ